MSSTTDIPTTTEISSTKELPDITPDLNSDETSMNGIPRQPKSTQSNDSNDSKTSSITIDTPTKEENKIEMSIESKDLDFTLNANGNKVFTIAKGLTKTLITENINGQSVSDHILGRVWINIKGQTKNGIVFDDHLFEESDFVLGQANQPKGIEMAVSTMRHGEHAIIKIYDPKYSYSKFKCPDSCPLTMDENNADQWPLIFDLIVIDSMSKHKQSQDMTFKEQLSRADELRGRGNKRYQKKRFVTALKFYMKAVQCLDAMQDMKMKMPVKHAKVLEKVDVQEVERMQCKCFLNISICQLRIMDYNKGIEYATKAIDLDVNAKKAYMRRGICLFHLGEYDGAEENFQTFDNFPLDAKEKKLSHKWHQRLQNSRRKSKLKEKEMYGGFFDKSNVKGAKFGLYDDKVDNSDGSDEGYVQYFVNGVGFVIESLITICTDCCSKKKKEKDT